MSVFRDVRGTLASPAADAPRVLLWGAASQARVVAQMLRESGAGIVAVLFDATRATPAFDFDGIFVADAHALGAHLAGVTHYVTCIGAEHGYARVMTSRTLERRGLRPLDLVHPRAFVEPTAVVGAGCQVMPGAIVHKFAQVGVHAILNTNSTVEHESRLGAGVHLMSGATVAGRVAIGDYATIGMNATVLPDLTIGEGAFVGAGAVVTRDIEPYAVVAGVPARRLRTHRPVFFDAPLRILEGR